MEISFSIFVVKWHRLFWGHEVTLWDWHCILLTALMNVCVCSVVSDSVWPHRLQPARPLFLCPWDFSSQNTGMGCQFLLWGIFLTQGLNLRLLLGKWFLYHWVVPWFKNIYLRISLVVHWVSFCLSVQGVWVWFLVRELRFYIPHRKKKKKK